MVDVSVRTRSPKHEMTHAMINSRKPAEAMIIYSTGNYPSF
jgi:hypothetical protein